MPGAVRSRSLPSYILRPLVRHLAPASRLLTPSANDFITSLEFGHFRQPRFVLDLNSDEGRESAQQWYKRQGQNTRFTHLEYRKDKTGRVRHEFIVVWLSNSTLCRFDRRARNGGRGHILREEGAPAEDSAHVLSPGELEYRQVLDQTEALLTIELPDGDDLSVILAVCEGIQAHTKASAYNLMQHNCYFFSWMIVAAVARRTCQWEAAIFSKGQWANLLCDALTPVFPDSTQCNSPGDLRSSQSRSVGGRFWRRAFSKPYVQSQDNFKTLVTSSIIESFRALLLSEYLDFHGTIESILSKVLLRSQIGPALEKELKWIETYGLHWAKRTMAENEILKATLRWKSIWVECDRLGAKYASAVTRATLGAVEEHLGDMDAKFLTFGDRHQPNESNQSSVLPSVQEFIRGRMREHFAVVEKLGFGSFQMLMTTAEAEMCDIWRTSLGIIKLNRFQPHTHHASVRHNAGRNTI